MRANEVDSLKDVLGGGQVLDGPRSSRRSTAAARNSTQGNSRPKYAEYGESDLDDDDEEEAEEEDDAEEDEEEEEDAPDDFEEVGAEPEGDTDEDDDEDVEMEDAPPAPPAPGRRQVMPKAPKITLKPPAKTDSKQPAKPTLVVTPAKVGPVKSVEDQEMEDDPDDEEVDSSGLSEDEEDQTNLNDEDAEGELGAEEDDDDDLSDSSDETPASGAATPDPTKMTKRQRGRPEDQGTLMALDMAPQQRKVGRQEARHRKRRH
jgi:Ino eighty subunit 2